MPYTLIGMIGTITLANNVSCSNSNPCNLMTLNNQVIICDDIEYSGKYIAYSTLFTLSDSSMFPANGIILPISVSTDYGIEQANCYIDSNGQVSVDNSYYNPLFLFNGFTFHVNDKYYNPTIGNIYNNGTSPLSQGYN